MPEKDTLSHPWLMERRYLPLIIVVVFVILSASAFTISYQRHTSKTEQILKEDWSDANLISLLLDEHLKKIVSVMESYGNRQSLLQAVKDKNVKKAMVHLINLKKSNPDVDILVITDKQGTLWAAYPERPELLGQNLAYQDWYKGVIKEWKSNISDVVLRIVREKDLAVTMSVPIFDETGEVIGILVNTQRTVALSYLFKQAPLDPGAFITVTDRKGQIVYSSRHDVEKEIRPYPFHPDMKKVMAANNKTFAVDDPDLGGRTRYISFAPAVNIGWTVFVERDKRSIFLSELAYYVQVTAIAFLLFLSVILFLFYSRKQVMAQQILEQLQAEKQIRIRDERYKSYIDITMQLAWTTNDKGEIVEDNPSWSKYTGHSYEEIKGFGYIEDIHPNDRDRTVQIWRKAVAEKSFYETEYRLRRYDGVYRDYLVRGIPLLAEDGSVRDWVGTCIDITEVKRMTAAMEENDLKYRALFENQLNGLAYCKIVVDENNRPVDYIFLEINTAFEEHTGLKKKDVLGRRITEIIPGFEKSTFDFIGVHGRVALTAEAVRFEQYQEGLQRWYSVFVYSPKEGYFVSIFSDITERKQHENEIKELGLRSQRILNAAGEGIYGLNVDGQITFINPAAAKMLGYENQELIGKISHDTFHHTRPDGSPYKGEDSPIYKSFRDGIPHHQDRDIFIRKDGTTIPVEYTSSPIIDSDKVIGGVVALRDITERTRVEAELQLERDNFKSILDTMNEGIYIVDQQHNIQYINPVIESDFGPVNGRKCFAYFHDRTEACPWCKNQEVFAGKSVEWEWSSLKTGKTYELFDTPIRNADGTVFKLEIFRDITEHKQMDKALRESEERYRSIFENAQEGIFRSTPEGRIILANEAIAKMLGYDSPEEIMAGVTDVSRQLYVYPEERTIIKNMLEEHGFVRNHETQLYRKDGSIFWVSVTMQAIRDEKGQFLYYEGMNQDITDRKESVERMRTALRATVRAMAVTVETRDPYTAGHQRRVADLARAIATEMNLPTDQIDGIRMAAVIHDLGKISVPAEILSKPTKLTDLEFGIIKTHAQSGYDILKDIDFPWPIARIILEHHERMDGSGYPKGLVAEETLLESRILSVADVVESMASHRPYRPALGIDVAMKEIENNRGTHYDTSTVDACLRIFRENGYQLKGT